MFFRAILNGRTGRGEYRAIKIAIIMMQKNEGEMLDVWVRHHTRCVGVEDIYIFDNGSDDKKTIQSLREFENLGINVNYDFSTRGDFNSKGKIILDKIQELQAADKYDFYFPMDADEILGVDINGVFSFEAGKIREELSNYIGTRMVLRIGCAFDNNPIYEGKYLVTRDQRKCFFYKDTAKHLDVGFHKAATFGGTKHIRTKIAYIHFHHKKYEEKIKRTSEKLDGRVASFLKEDLLSYRERKGMGFHLIDDMLVSRDQYYERYKSDKKLVEQPMLSEYLKSIGVYSKISSMMDFDYLTGSHAIDRDKNEITSTTLGPVNKP